MFLKRLEKILLNRSREKILLSRREKILLNRRLEKILLSLLKRMFLSISQRKILFSRHLKRIFLSLLKRMCLSLKLKRIYFLLLKRIFLSRNPKINRKMYLSNTKIFLKNSRMKILRKVSMKFGKSFLYLKLKMKIFLPAMQKRTTMINPLISRRKISFQKIKKFQNKESTPHKKI